MNEQAKVSGISRTIFFSCLFQF